MAFDSEKLLDRTGLELLRLLQEDARMSFAELGRRVGLTPPAVAERVRRMEEAGIITGYHARLNADKLGLPIRAFIRVGDCEPCERLIRLVKTQPEVIECHMLTGSDSYLLQVVVASVAQLEALISRLRPFARSLTTSIVLESPVDKRGPDVRLCPPKA
ncbi:MAG: Lrp/AsnC family transcriptional regulator [Chloroflexi bacterium]|jgi:Lrp/AsnC family leucine-responsive transcriptional regulator|uniref:AsnC family transcriptional regulator n=1 Tax=Candidatus Thermofonsia Clade 3 bacterium TaxID=2364212 RepID=A0A2M8QDT4_9CHLR|nr:Lrp/AsnC family transcriptional regulator [Candidatus Roseilinea sp. NK_OTU-006]PJF47912.1 MAG: AsnC family transcriptional regulator [Candidatus Thermofonsia Clade 3 bacterium]RMG64354.1 MAG: Lrp/AsnC family transcriptional regulator [Chloroflexota bacterium]